MRAKMESGKLQTTWFERHRRHRSPGPHPSGRRTIKISSYAGSRSLRQDPNIALIEQPEYKRRWNTEPWAIQLATSAYGPGSSTASNPTSTSTAG